MILLHVICLYESKLYIIEIISKFVLVVLTVKDPNKSVPNGHYLLIL